MDQASANSAVLTYHFPINHSSRYYRPAVPRPAFPDKRRFSEACLEAPGEDKMATIVNEPLSRHALAFVLAGGAREAGSWS